MSPIITNNRKSNRHSNPYAKKTIITPNSNKEELRKKLFPNNKVSTNKQSNVSLIKQAPKKLDGKIVKVKKTKKIKVKKEKKKLSPREKRIRYFKWFIYIVLAIIIFYSYKYLLAKAFELMQKNPSVWAVYKAIEAEVASKSLLGLFYASSLGAIFFISLPVEVIFVYYLGLNYYFVQVITIILVGNLLGMWFDYFFGWIVGEKFLKWVMKKKYDVFKNKIDKMGAFLIIVGNIIPFPIEFFAVFLGAIRYGFYKYTIYTVIGKTIKFLLIYFGYVYFMKFVGPYIDGLTINSFIGFLKGAFFG